MAISSAPVEAKKQITLDECLDGTFSPNTIMECTPLKGGSSFAALSNDGRKIIVYSFSSGKQTGTMFSLDDTPIKIGEAETAAGQTSASDDKSGSENGEVKSIDGFSISPDGKKILLYTNAKYIYRHSFTAEYFVYDTATKQISRLSGNGKQQSPLFSPDGNTVAFMREGNLFARKDDKEVQLTSDGKRGEVLNGTPDWVYEEEFATDCSACFSSDGKKIAWIRYDESKVKEYSLQMFKGLKPTHSENVTYPSLYSYKYPKAGEDNSKVEVRCCDLNGNGTTTLDIPLDADGYIPRIFTSPAASDEIIAVTSNRHQSHVKFYRVNLTTGKAKLILEDKDDRHVSDLIFECLILTPKHIVMCSDKSGYNHLYVYDYDGRLEREIGEAKEVITSVYGYDEKTQTAIVQSCLADDPTVRTVAALSPGKKVVIGDAKGWNSIVALSGDCRYAVHSFSNLEQPNIYTVRKVSDGVKVRTIEDNSTLKNTYDGYEQAQKEMIKIPVGGTELNALIFKPANFDANKKYPLVIYQYSGPGNQQVTQQWKRAYVYEQYLAARGFVVAVIDPRGTGGRGAEFEKCTYLRLGEKESADIADAALWLGQQSYIDASRMGIWGWSYGGFNTLMSMSEGRGVFRAGVAVAPPTSWRYYDTIYTERYMRTPQENPEGYDSIAPMARAAQLKGDLLICHGLADDNVHPQNTMEYVETLVQADKDFSMMIYTNRNHGIYGGNTRNHLYRKITEFFVEKLKP